MSQELIVIGHERMMFELTSEVYYNNDGSIKMCYQQLWNNIFLDQNKQTAYLRTGDYKNNNVCYQKIATHKDNMLPS
jgi:hypothetical protein